MPTAADVQRAFQVDIPVGEIITRNQQIGQQLEQQRLEKQRQADTDAFNHEKYLEEKYGGVTGTPADAVIMDRLSKAKAAIYEAQQKNPNRPLSYMQREAISQPYLHGLDVYGKQAKLLEAELPAYLAEFKTKYPYADVTKVKAAASNAMFRDPATGEIKSTLDVDSLPNFFTGIADPRALRPFVDPNLLAEHYKKGINAENVQEVLHAGMKGDPLDYKVKFVPGVTKFDPINKQVTIDAVPIKVGEATGQMMTPAAYNAFTTTDDRKFMVANTQEKLAASVPGYTDLPPEQQQLIAGYETAVNSGILNKTVVEPDYKRATYNKSLEQLQMAKHSQANQDAYLRLATTKAEQSGALMTQAKLYSDVLNNNQDVINKLTRDQNSGRRIVGTQLHDPSSRTGRAVQLERDDAGDYWKIEYDRHNKKLTGTPEKVDANTARDILQYANDDLGKKAIMLNNDLPANTPVGSFNVMQNAADMGRMQQLINFSTQPSPFDTTSH